MISACIYGKDGVIITGQRFTNVVFSDRQEEVKIILMGMERTDDMNRKDSKGRALKAGESYRESENRYMFRYTDKRTGKRVAVYASSLPELREKEQEIQHRIACKLLTTTEARHTDLNNLYEHYRKTLNARETTILNYDSVWEHHVKDNIGRMKVVDIGASHIKELYAEMTKKGYAKGTLKIIHGILCPMLDLAVDDGIIIRNPAKGKLAGYGVKPKERNALSVEQQENLIGFLGENNCYNMYLPLVQIMIGTACRIGEISGLRWEDVDMERRVIRIDHQLVYKKDGERTRFIKHMPKTEKGTRDIPMIDSVYNAFKEQKKIQFMLRIPHDVEVEGMKGFVFTSKSGMPLAPNAFNSIFRNIVNAYNRGEERRAERDQRKAELLPHISCHVLRHTGCTRMSEAGVDIKVTQAVMGQKDINTTLGVYTHVVGKDRVANELAKMNPKKAVG